MLKSTSLHERVVTDAQDFGMLLLLFFYLTMSLTILSKGLLTLLMNNSKYNVQRKILAKC